MHNEVTSIVEENAARNPRDVQIAREYKKPRPHVTAFSDRLCHLERLALNSMLEVAGPSAMCPEYDGLVLFTDYYGKGLKEKQLEVVASTSRRLAAKPYPATMQQWLLMAMEKYPYEDWGASSRFPWKSVQLAWRSVRTYIHAEVPSKLIRPDADFSLVTAAMLEGTVVVHPGGVSAFDGKAWQEVTKMEGLHEIVKRTAHEILVLEAPRLSFQHGHWSFHRATKVWLRAKQHSFTTTLRMEVGEGR